MRKMMGIYLAAGYSRRMGVNKLALPLKHSTVGSLGLENALSSRLDDIIVVVRKEDDLDWIDPALRGNTKKNGLNLVRCGTENHGQAESLKTGIKQAIQLQMDAIVIMLADQPFVTKEIIEDLINQYERFDPPFVAARLQGIIQPPVLFTSRVFPSLLKLEGDQGAKSLFANHQIGQGSFIDFKDDRLLLDVDQIKDYEKAIKYTSS
ncbi:NTP transferase domain-containing protein [Fictibacillus enclensis]|uniref:NTP transferase domain-containing protein n=1 Tax=Fictibacillus enclensis TaxID=1017270 RepID=UPI0024C03CA5|nr:NTP transferase domain-containing protein [Fictibacillus enclensis]WHY70191.1 NTP transferase domain-containing protein [Fictibacillus enclensis]